MSKETYYRAKRDLELHEDMSEGGDRRLAAGGRVAPGLRHVSKETYYRAKRDLEQHDASLLACDVGHEAMRFRLCLDCV